MSTMSAAHQRDLTLRVTRREGLALLSALELSPFDDEVLVQKLLNLVYAAQPPSTHLSSHRRRARDFTHHRR
jgi:hypothetical protein